MRHSLTPYRVRLRPAYARPTNTTSVPTAVVRHAPLLLRRLAALFYDLWVCVALWLLLSALVTLVWTVAGHAPQENIAPFSAWQLLLWLVCWIVSGLYAVASWRHGGQTLGMRPWKVRVVAGSGGPADKAALWRRYAWGSVSLLAGGLGFAWALVDRQGLTLHDRLSGTRLERT